MQHAVPQALKKGKPGTPAFRTALKEVLESSKGIPLTQGVIKFTPADHFGLANDARMMLTIENGNWKLVSQ